MRTQPSQVSKVTIKDIARKARCHYSLVSLALRDETSHRVYPKTREKILKICNQLNYFPDHSARQLVNRKCNTVVFALPYFAEMIASEHYARIISGVISGTSENGLDLHFLIANEGKMDAHSRKHLYGKSIAGIITVAPDASDVFFNELKGLKVPVVVVGTHDPKHGTHHVFCDNEASSFKAVSYLIKCGHEEIGMIKGPSQSFDANARFSGYRKALKASGIPYRENRVAGAKCFSIVHGYEAGKDLLAHFERPSALFCASDEIAIGCLKALKEANIHCPREISVVGFDGISLAEHHHPALTTVSQPFFEMGKAAVDLLRDLTQEAAQGIRDRMLETRFMVRESVSRLISGEPVRAAQEEP